MKTKVCIKCNIEKEAGEFTYRKGASDGYEVIVKNVIMNLLIKTALTEDEAFKLNYYTNLQPLCSYINRDVKKYRLDYGN